jgi:hypothetical protein
MSVSISMTDERAEEGIMGIIRLEHVVQNRNFKNKISKFSERKEQVRFKII